VRSFATSICCRVKSQKRPTGLFGRRILLGLEFLVAADIIRTVAAGPSLKAVGVLGLIVLIRTFLSFRWRSRSTAPGLGAAPSSARRRRRLVSPANRKARRPKPTSDAN
jgi:Protein of unknown function (DUF1622)